MITIREYMHKTNKDLGLLIEDRKDYLVVDFLIKDKISKTEYITLEELRKIVNMRDYKKVGDL